MANRVTALGFKLSGWRQLPLHENELLCVASVCLKQKARTWWSREC